MKHKLWLFQIPIVALFTFAFYVSEAGIRGSLDSSFLRNKIFPSLRVISGAFTNAKFQIRGPVPPKNKVVIVEIDSDALAQIGRWPWHRDITAYLIEKIFQAGAKVVGLDMTFSEPDRRISEDLGKLLKEKSLDGIIEKFETDHELKKTIALHKGQLVLGWSTENWCQPAYRSSAEECPVTDPEHLAALPKFFEKFSYQNFETSSHFDPTQSPFISAPDVIANIPMYNDAAEQDRKSTRLNSSHSRASRMPSSA